MAGNKQTVPTVVRLPGDLRDDLEAEAQNQETNISTVLRQIVRRWQRDRKNPDLESKKPHGRR